MSGRDRFPPQIKYIIGNEAAERYSFYGMKAILTLFMTQTLLFEESDATATFHLFTAAAYFTPLIGGYISDRFWGKYRTIITLSWAYVAGHAVLAIWESKEGLYVGLALIAFGAGGIKPCVSAHVGDQFTESTKHLVGKVFGWFYVAINFGAFFASLLTPWTRKMFGAQVAFGVPGVLMAIALFVFWLGRHYYITVPPTGKRDDTPLKVLYYARVAGLQAALDRFGRAAVDAALAVPRVALVLLPVVGFWALFDQTGSSWVVQATLMELHGLEPDQLQAINPLFVMGIVPLFTVIVYPAFARRGSKVSALQRMTVGMFLTSLSFVAVAVIESFVDSRTVSGLFVAHVNDLAHAGVPLDALADRTVAFFSEPLERISALWQLVPYLILTAAEVLVSVTGLEFAYTQAPRSAKSTVMALWFLTVSLGNLLAATVAGFNVFAGVAYYGFWAALMGLIAIVFAVIARTYTPVEFIESDDMAK
jgi:POT family proton-dependent oligopeptide transporter